MSSDDADARTRQSAGMRAMFWIWAGLIAGGLTVMIVTPLGGR